MSPDEPWTPQAKAFVRSQEKWKHPRYRAAWVLRGLPG